ncbi:MAG: lyase family protein, partial [Acidimicrobiia bacterium]
MAGSLALVRMLGAGGILDPADVDSIVGGLEEIQASATAGTFEFEDGDEDVHSAVERRLYELVGDAAGMLHTGRSRNDQVALDMRLYLLRSGEERIRDLAGFVS